MKTGLFASPNLKLILAGAALVAVLQQVIDPGESPDPQLVCQAGAALPAAEVDQLVNRTFEQPTAANYDQLSWALLQRGDYRTALFYSRKASLAAEVEK